MRGMCCVQEDLAVVQAGKNTTEAIHCLESQLSWLEFMVPL